MVVELLFGIGEMVFWGKVSGRLGGARGREQGGRCRELWTHISEPHADDGGRGFEAEEDHRVLRGNGTARIDIRNDILRLSMYPPNLRTLPPKYQNESRNNQ